MSKELRIRFLSTYEPPTSFYRDLLPRLASDGFRVELILSSTEYRPERGALEDAVSSENVDVTRIPSGVPAANSLASKIAAMTTFLVGAASHTLRRSTDVNVFMSNPPLFALWGLVLRSLRGQRYVCCVQDLYPEVLVQSGAARGESVVTRVISKLMDMTLVRADAVVVIGRCMRQRMIDKGVKAGRVVVIENWSPVSAEEFELVESRPRSGNVLTVQYSGNMGVSHSFDEIVDAMRILEAETDSIRFEFVGNGSRRRQVEEAGLQIAKMRPFVANSELAQSLASCDVHFVTLRPGFEGLVVPSKAYGAFASGRPIVYVGNAHGEVAQEIREFDLGSVVEPGDVGTLVSVLRRYAADDEYRRRQGENGRQVSRGRLSAEHALDSWSRFFEEHFRSDRA